MKRLIKRKKYIENEFLKESSLSFIFFRILALFYFPNTIYPATPNHKDATSAILICPSFLLVVSSP